MYITPEDFKQAFEAAFIVNRGHLRWDTSKRKTANMLAHIYRYVASSFPVTKIEYEHNSIDAVLYRNDLEHIDVAIEHENDVRTIENELDNFAKYNFPLNVLITYTGARDGYLNKHSAKMNVLCDRLLVIVNPEQCCMQHDPDKHNLVLWEYLLWTKNGFQKL